MKLPTKRPPSKSSTKAVARPSTPVSKPLKLKKAPAKRLTVKIGRTPGTGTDISVKTYQKLRKYAEAPVRQVVERKLKSEPTIDKSAPVVVVVDDHPLYFKFPESE